MFFIGIDPGVNTGFAVWSGDTQKFLAVATLGITEALSEALRFVESAGPDNAAIFFEDARQRKYLPRERNLSEYRGKLMGAGSVKRDCDIWEEFCTRHAIPFRAIPPRKGLTKWDADYFARVTGWKGRTSNHARDAALLVWGQSEKITTKV